MTIAEQEPAPAPPPLPARVRRLPIEQARERVLTLLTDPNPPQGPRAEPCVCTAPRWEHTGAGRNGRCLRTECQRYRRDVVDTLVERALDAAVMTFGDELREFERRQRAKRTQRAEGTLGIGPSDTANCPKAIEYRERPPEDFVADPEDKRPARIGGMLHRDWVTVSETLYPWRLHEYHVPIPGLDSKNTRLDRYDPVTATLDDGKTAGNWAWDRLGDEGPAEEVWEQVQIYALGMIRLGFPVRTVRLVYIKRENGHDEIFARPYDEEAATKALDRLLGYAATLDAGGHLPRTRTGPSTDGICRGCFARSHCWNLPRAAQLHRSGESVTVLGEDIDPVEVEFFAAGVYAAKRAKSEAEKAEKEGLAILKGIPHAEYGAFSYEPGGRWVTDLKKRAEQLEAHYDEPDEMRPPLGTLDPPRRRDSWDTVKPVRAAKRQPKTKPPTPDEVLASAPDEVVPVAEQEDPGQAVGA